MNVLVLTSEAIDAAQLRQALGGEVDPADTQVMVVAPALHDSPLKFWMSDADEAIAKAEQVSRQTVEKLGDAGVPATADTGESDPLEAVEDVLRTFPADRIVLFAHPEGERRYREGLDPSELQTRFGVPVRQATVAPAP
jgi:nucleotide-binding universal stress UspA family protein